LAVAQLAAEPNLQLRSAATAATAAATSTAAAAAAASGDADVPGWFGDLGNGDLPGTASASAAATAGA
jgi:hypothetical protein